MTRFLRRALEGVLDDDEMPGVVSAFDQMGDIAVIRIPPELYGRRGAIGEALLYAEPIYLQAESLAFPELKRVVLATNERVVMAPTLNEAVAALLAGTAPATVSGAPAATGGIPREALQRVLDALLQSLDSLETGASDLEQSVNALRDLLAPTE